MRGLRRCTIGLCVLLLASGCASDEITGSDPSNRPPEVWLSIGPPEGSLVEFSVHLYWGGFDPDGNLSHFEYTITNDEDIVFNPADTTGDWKSTDVTDSVFIFTADDIPDSSAIDFSHMKPYEFVKPHTFFIRAVDEQGARSAPIYRSFTSKNLSPVISVTVPRPYGTTSLPVPPVITFRWVGLDFTGIEDETVDPDSVRSILVHTKPFGGSPETTLQYIRDHPQAPEWTDWIAYNAPGDSGRFWRPSAPLSYGTYVFVVQAKDGAGAISPVYDIDKNVRFIRVNDKFTGPVLLVSNKFMNSVSTTTTETRVTVLDMPAGIPISFKWRADAASYGGTVVGYRYGWDILDLSNEDEWETTYTPFVGSTASSPARSFFFGTHTFYVEVQDDSGLRSRVPIVLNIVPFTMEQPLLLIDDWEEGPSRPSFLKTKGALPSDEEHDDFWEEVLSDVAGFTPAADVRPYRGTLSSLPISVLAQYQAVIWNTRSLPNINTLTLADEMLRFGSDELNLLSLFMQAGGKVLLCGEHAMTTAIDKSKFPPIRWGRTRSPSYPLIFKYELGGDQTGPYESPGVGETSFPYDDYCLNVIDIAYGLEPGKDRIYCRVNRTYDALDDGLRECLPIDTDYDFPKLTLRPEVGFPGRYYAPDKLGIETDLFNPPYFSCSWAELDPRRPCFEPIYGLGCLNTSSKVYNAPVAVWSSRYADVPNAHGKKGRSVVLGFSPVFFSPDQFRQALGIILFDEWQLPRN